MSAFAIEIVFSPPPPEDTGGSSRSLFHHGVGDDEGEGYDPAEHIVVHASVADCDCCAGTGLFCGSSRCPACKGSGVQRPHHRDVIDGRYRASLVRELRPGEQLPW